MASGWPGGGLGLRWGGVGLPWRGLAGGVGIGPGLTVGGLGRFYYLGTIWELWELKLLGENWGT